LIARLSEASLSGRERRLVPRGSFIKNMRVQVYLTFHTPAFCRTTFYYIFMAKMQNKPSGGARTQSQKKTGMAKPGGTKRKIQTGIVHIRATFNNTLVTVTDTKGNVLAWSSAGACGFKGARKSTPFAAQEAATAAVRQSIEQGLRQVQVMISGPGSGRETALRAIQAAGIGITLIRDITPIPHNGCRPPKKRRV